MARILIVDDETKLAALAGEMLTLDGHHIQIAGNQRDAVRTLGQSDFDLVLTDLRLPDGDGLAVLKEARKRTPPAEVILMTAYGSTDNAVEAMKGGAADYLTKPFAMDELRIRVRRVTEASDATRLSVRLVQQLTPRLIAESPAMRATLQLAERAAATDQPVLITGESGTGKTQLARLIHYSSRRRAGTLSELHCASLSPEALERELFGSTAPTGTDGKVAAAHRGTLFLDEIGDLETTSQASLLRLLQSGEVGASRKVDVRVVATTNRDLRARMAAAQFREDLYYRLNVLSITVPPLRDRQADIIPLAEHVLARHGLVEKKLNTATRQRLLSYGWPGNVRELENSIERAIVLAGDGDLAPIHFDFPQDPSTAPGPQQVLVAGFNLDAFERDLVFSAIERAGGNKAAAARLLGITRRRLYSRLQSFEDRFGEPTEEV
jgi:DNA-binding NtrC family response regulator